MTLILAVEPDPRQAARLSAVLHGRRQTEVLIAGSAGEAIASVKGRIPTVLLTSQLLSPQDETRLADWMRGLGPAAAGVQALTIPILATTPPNQTPQRGILSSLRRRRDTPEANGCEPKVFAEHVAAYLDQNGQGRIQPDASRGTPASELVEPEPTILPEPESIIEPIPLAEIPEPELVVVASHPAGPEPSLVMLEPEIDLQLEMPASQPATVATETVVANTAAEDEGVWFLTRSPQVIEFDNQPSPEPQGALLPDVMSAAPSAQILTLPPDVVPMSPLEVVFELPEVVTVNDDGFETAVLKRAVAAVAATPPAEETDTPSGMAWLAGDGPDTTPPAQDEWGFFDPSKCGFSALLTKLDEITGADTPAPTESSVRLITHY